MPESPFLTVREFAKYVRIHHMTLYKWLKKNRNGVPGAFKVGGQWRFNVQEFEKSILEKC